MKTDQRLLRALAAGLRGLAILFLLTSAPLGAAVDSDGDGVTTLEERGMDTDRDGVPNRLDDDDDGDGTPTRDEIYPPYPDVDGDQILDYLDADEEDGPLADPDHDGLKNAQEERVGSDPRNADTDGDTVFDNEEINPNGGGARPRRVRRHRSAEPGGRGQCLE